MDYEGHFTRLADDECRRLVRARTVGRVAWTGSAGTEVLPVTYTVSDGVIAFRTRPNTVMGAFLEPVEVTFEIDDVDEDTATGWSVLIRGTAVGHLDEVPGGVELPRPWAPGEHPLIVVITPSGYSGRAVSAGTKD